MLNLNARTRAMVEFRTVGGGREVAIETAEDFLLFDRDPDAFAAKHLGVTKDQYVAWIETNGHPLCAARTKRGTLCQNMLQSEHESKRYACLHRLVYCAVHDPRSK